LTNPVNMVYYRMATKICTRCCEPKSLTKFFPSVATPDHLKPLCMSCYFVRNGGRSPRGFRYLTPPNTIKVWITHGTLWPNYEARVTIAEAIIRPADPTMIDLLPPIWDEDGGSYRQPDWHVSEQAALTEIQRLVEALVEEHRKEYVAACNARAVLRKGQGIKTSFR